LAFLLTGYRWTAFGERITYNKVLLLGLVGSAVAVSVLAGAGSIYQFAIVYFVMGIFMASLGPVSSAIIATKVDEDFRGRAYGIQQSAGTFGGLIAPITAGVVGGYLGYRWLFAVIGVCVVLGSTLVRYSMTRWPVGSLTSELKNA
jgi:MFS family permease